MLSLDFSHARIRRRPLQAVLLCLRSAMLDCHIHTSDNPCGLICDVQIQHCWTQLNVLARLSVQALRSCAAEGSC